MLTEAIIFRTWSTVGRTKLNWNTDEIKLEYWTELNWNIHPPITQTSVI